MKFDRTLAIFECVLRIIFFLLFSPAPTMQSIIIITVANFYFVLFLFYFVLVAIANLLATHKIIVIEFLWQRPFNGQQIDGLFI